MVNPDTNHATFENTNMFSLDVETVHTGLLKAFELSAGSGFLEDLASGHQHGRTLTKRHTLNTCSRNKKLPDYTFSSEVSQPRLEKEIEDYNANLDYSYYPSPLSLSSVLLNGKELILLLMLYTIQGIPMGLSASIPFMLQGHVTYNQLGIFSLVSLPFSFKILWAPIVDSAYLPSLGRRKSWLIPVQLLCSIFMYLGALDWTVDHWMGRPITEEIPNVPALLCYFGCLYFLMATQDVIVDGWSLTILSEENRPLSSVCNAIGQTLGFSVAHIGFLALQDAETCNRWFRSVPSDTPIVTLGSFLQFWSIIIFATTIVTIFFPESKAHPNKNTNDKDMDITEYKNSGDGSIFENLTLPNDSAQERRELCSTKNWKTNPAPTLGSDSTASLTTASADDSVINEQQLSVLDTYKLLLRMLTFRPVVELSVILLTCRLAFGSIDAAAHLKLIEAGMGKEQLAFFGPFLIPISILCPMLISRVTCGPRPLKWFVYGWSFRWIMSFVWIGLISITKTLHATVENKETVVLPIWFYPLLFVTSALHSSATDLMFSSQMGFFARISDPAIGGTYMTLLNTITNIGNKWPSTLSLLTLDLFTTKRFGDGLILQTLVFSLAGLLWLRLSAPLIKKLENTNKSQWLIIGDKEA